MLPFFLQRKRRPLPAGLAVPPIGIPQIAFFAVQVRMDPGSIFIRYILNEFVCFFPIAFRIVPQRLQINRNLRWNLICRYAFFKKGCIHSIKINGNGMRLQPDVPLFQNPMPGSGKISFIRLLPGWHGLRNFCLQATINTKRYGNRRTTATDN